jgi:hypothetical protein
MITHNADAYWFDDTIVPTPGYYKLRGVMCFEGLDGTITHMTVEDFALYLSQRRIKPQSYDYMSVHLPALSLMHSTAVEASKEVACNFIRSTTGMVTSPTDCPYQLIREWVALHNCHEIAAAYDIVTTDPYYQCLADYLAPQP